jgi:hypothetical protein
MPCDRRASRARAHLAISALGRPGEEKVIAECIADPKCTPAQAALKLRQAENVTGKGRLRSLAADDTNLETPGPNGPAADAKRQCGGAQDYRRTRESHFPKPE